MAQRSGRWRAAAVSWGIAILLSGCATLPSSGPTGAEIRASAAGKHGDFPFAYVEIESPLTLPPAAATPVSDLPSIPPQPTNMLGPGDILNIAIYEAGVRLFGGSAVTVSTTGGASFNPSSSAERLSGIRVDDQGYITVPFVGRIRAAGRTTSELESVIENGLHGLSQDPQVLVSVQESITNSVLMAGDVANPGRLVLATNRESLVDAIALAGGYRGDAKDAVARVQRDGETFELRLSDLLDRPQEDFRVVPGDRITLIKRPQSFSVLGAPNRAEEITFPRSTVTLAEAVALSGGANPNQGDAAGVFVFRYVPQPDGSSRGTVYHLNMMHGSSYLLAQQFVMRDRDVLYVANARANQLTKFVQLLSQLFIPVTTVRATLPNTP
jgi:polysaccharide export outer membrane protein